MDEVFDNHHAVVKQSGAAAGRFTFTAAEAGEHRLCITPSRAVAGGARVGPHHSPFHVGTVRLTLDLAIGQTSKIERTDKGKMQDIAGRVRDLRSRLEDIRKEQVFQRVRGPRDGTAQSAALGSRTTIDVELTCFPGARGGVQRSVGADELACGAVDDHSADYTGSYVRMAAFASKGLLY